MSITWSKYFDKIYCIHFVEYKNRKELLEYELDRVGILKSGIFQYQYTYGNNFDKNLEKHLRTNIPSLRAHKRDSISLILGDYKCIRSISRNNCDTFCPVSKCVTVIS